MEYPKNGYSLKRGEGTQINFRGTSMTLKAVSEQTDGAYSLIEMLHPPDVGPALHTHHVGQRRFMSWTVPTGFVPAIRCTRQPPATLCLFQKACPIVISRA